MLIINYSKEGMAYPDAETIYKVEEYINSNHNNTIKINVSTENIINAFRLAIVENRINVSEIKFQFEGQDLEVNEYGVFKIMPKGFVDYNDTIIRNIVRRQSEKRKKVL